MKRMIVSVIVTVALCVGLTVPAFAAGGDTPSSWAAPQVDAAIAANLVPAGLQSSYTRAITRAEFAALAVAMYETATGKEMIVDDSAAFADTTDVNVEKTAALGIVAGVSDDRFDPDAELTREQAAVILWRLIDSVQNMEWTVANPLETGKPTFADNGSISDWALDSVGVMQASGIMEGVGGDTFAPREPYTREQSIVTVMRAYEYAGVTPQTINIRSFDIKSINATFVPALGEDYIGVLPPLGIDSGEFQLDTAENTPAGIALNSQVLISGREYEPFITVEEGELIDVRFRTDVDNIADALPDVRRLFEELNALYGAPSTYPELPNRLSEYLENDDATAQALSQPFSYTETWTVRDNFDGIEDMEIQAELSTMELRPAGAQPVYWIELVYAIKYTGLRDGAGAYRQVR